MTDEEIVELYFSRNQTALSATAERYGGFLRAVSSIFYITAATRRSASAIHISPVGIPYRPSVPGP